MKEENQINAPVKERILQLIGELGISKREFYTLTGISRGTLESKSGITVKTLTRIFCVYPDLCPRWVLTGNGKKFQSESLSEYDGSNIEDKFLEVIRKKDAEIKNLSEEIGKLKQEIIQLRTEMLSL